MTDEKIIEDVAQIIDTLSKETNNIFTEGEQYWEDRHTENYGPGLYIDVKNHEVHYGAEKHVRESGNYNVYKSYETLHVKKFDENLLSDLGYDSIKVRPSEEECVKGSTVYMDLKKRFPEPYWTFRSLPTASHYTPPMRECDLWC